MVRIPFFCTAKQCLSSTASFASSLAVCTWNRTKRRVITEMSCVPCTETSVEEQLELRFAYRKPLATTRYAVPRRLRFVHPKLLKKKKRSMYGRRRGNSHSAFAVSGLPKSVACPRLLHRGFVIPLHFPHTTAGGTTVNQKDRHSNYYISLSPRNQVSSPFI